MRNNITLEMHNTTKVIRKRIKPKYKSDDKCSGSTASANSLASAEVIDTPEL